MKNIINTILMASLSAAMTACIGNYEEINYDHYGPGSGDVLADDYALGSAMNNLAGCVISPDVNTAQFTDCLLGGTMGGYFADSQNTWTNTISNYNPTDDWTRVFLKSDKVIPVLYTNYNAVKAISEQTGNPVPLAIAKIIKVAAMHRITDTYGAIPYSKIGENGAITTPYDSQEQIYRKFFEELNEAITDLIANENEALVATADYIYSGNVKKWIKFANSLKLRLAMRIVYANKELAQQMAEDAVKHEGGLITTNDDNAAWNYFVTSSNPIYTAVRYNTPAHEADGKTCLSGGDSHAAADIICYMNGYNDPRRAKYFTKSEWKDEEYVGMRRGIVIPSLTTVGHKYSGVNIEPTSALMWMNAAEVAFLRAEGKAVFNFNMGGEARDFYEEGIRLSFAQWGVDGVNDYLNEKGAPTVYNDPNNGENSYGEPLSTVSVAWPEGEGTEAIQECIIIQKWIANWMIGHEAWSDHRRTGYPKLIPATPEGNRSGGVVGNEGAFRMPYPRDEYVNNAVNVSEAVAKYLGGRDNMGQKVWWDAK